MRVPQPLTETPDGSFSPLPSSSHNPLLSLRARLSAWRSLALWNALIFCIFFFCYFPPVLIKTPLRWPWIISFSITLQAVLSLLLLPFFLLLRRAAFVLHHLVYATLLFLLTLDLIVFVNVGIHLHDPMVWVTLRHPNGLRDMGIRFYHVLAAVLIFSLGYLSQTLFRFFYFRFYKTPALQQQRRRWLSISGFFLCGVALYLLAPKAQVEMIRQRLSFFSILNPRSSLYQAYNLHQRKLRERVNALRYPRKHLPPLQAHRYPRPHILLIASESLRKDMVNREDMPFTADFLKKHPSITSEHHFSNAHQTWEGMFSLLYGLAGHHRPTFYGLPFQPYNLKILKQLDYKLLAFTASSFKEIGYRPMVQIFDRHIDLLRQPPVPSDQKITNLAIEAIEAERRLPPEKQKPLFIILFYMSTHYPYTYPPTYQIFRPTLPDDHSRLRISRDYRQGLWNRYRNSTRFLDGEIKRLFEALKPEFSQKRLAWALVGDHGEEFWDQGAFGHAERRLNNSRTQTAFALHWPLLKSPLHVPLSQHADIFPTLFDLMGIDFPPEAYSDGFSLLKKREPHYIQVNGYAFPNLPSFGLFTPRYKIFARRTAAFHFEVNAVLDYEDRAVTWKKSDIEPVIRHWMKQVNHFYPGYELWESQTIHYNLLPSYPLAPTHGEIRSNQHPHRKPWDRVGRLNDFISRTQPPVQYPVHLRLGEFVELVGYNMPQKIIRLGDSIVIEFIFRCIKPIPQPYKFFFHTRLDQRPHFAGADHIPIHGNYPENDWKAGEYIRDPIRIETTNEWLSGSGRLHIGLYNRDTWARLPIFDLRTKKPYYLPTINASSSLSPSPTSPATKKPKAKAHTPDAIDPKKRPTRQRIQNTDTPPSSRPSLHVKMRPPRPAALHKRPKPTTIPPQRTARTPNHTAPRAPATHIELAPFFLIE